MINITINNNPYKIRNRFDEITVSEFDFITTEMLNTSNNEIGIRKNLIEKFSDGTIDKELQGELPLYIFEQITDLLFIDGEEYKTPTITKLKIGSSIYTIPMNKGEIDTAKVSAKKVAAIENIMKSDSTEKSQMIIHTLFNPSITFDKDIYEKVGELKISEVLPFIKFLETKILS